MMSIGASCGRATNPPNGNEPSEYCTVYFLFPKRLAEPDPELLECKDRASAPPEMRELVRDDEQIENDQDLDDDEDDATECEESLRY